MENVAVQLSQKVRKLKSHSLNQKCANCSLMRDYSTRQYQILMHKTDSFKVLSQTNNMNIHGKVINDIARSIAILGMYINV